MSKKPFDKELFKQYDDQAKKVVRKHYENLGFLVAYNENEYGADLVILSPVENGYYEKVALVECECRPSWSNNWPSNWNYQIMQRKRKYLNQGLPVIFCTLNQDNSQMIKFSGVLTDYPLIEKPNRYVSQGEMVFDIPVWENDDVEIVNLKPTKLLIDEVI